MVGAVLALCGQDVSLKYGAHITMPGVRVCVHDPRTQEVKAGDFLGLADQSAWPSPQAPDRVSKSKVRGLVQWDDG